MVDDAAAHELAMSQLPVPYSLALRLREAGVDPDAICEYVDVEPVALAGFFRLAEDKLAAILHQSGT